MINILIALSCCGDPSQVLASGSRELFAMEENQVYLSSGQDGTFFSFIAPDQIYKIQIPSNLNSAGLLSHFELGPKGMWMVRVTLLGAEGRGESWTVHFSKSGLRRSVQGIKFKADLELTEPPSHTWRVQGGKPLFLVASKDRYAIVTAFYNGTVGIAGPQGPLPLRPDDVIGVQRLKDETFRLIGLEKGFVKGWTLR